MKTLTPELQSHLASGATTMANCWILKRPDGVEFGFTDHDHPLTIEGIQCEPTSGLTGSDARQSNGFASDDQDISGILSSDNIKEVDLVAGRYNGATIETWRVNWSDPTQIIKLRVGYLGEVRRDDQSFQAEVRGLSVALEQEKGRIYQYGCDAIFGDHRCKVDLSRSDLSFSGQISKILTGTEIEVTLDIRPNSGRLSMGQLLIETGQASGMTFDILSHRQEEACERIELWHPIHADLMIGDAVTACVGCNKSFAACRDLFANQTNFRGFPHMPGNDFVLSYPEQNTLRNGSVLVEE